MQSVVFVDNLWLVYKCNESYNENTEADNIFAANHCFGILKSASADYSKQKQK